jgi:hypothetical protein
VARVVPARPAGEWPGALSESAGRAAGGRVGADLLCCASEGGGGDAGVGAGCLIRQSGAGLPAKRPAQLTPRIQMNDNPHAPLPQEPAWTRST